MQLLPEDLRHLWADLYRDEVARLAQASHALHPGDFHALAAAHATLHVAPLVTETTPPVATQASTRTAEEERLDVLDFIEAEIAKQVEGARTITATASRERCYSRANLLRTIAAYLKRGDHVDAAARETSGAT